MILRYGIYIAIFLIVFNLIWTIFSLDSAPLIKWSNEILTSETDKWALRGQIGDIMSGHFSALAFLAVALSILFQYEANKQMKESIEKQEKAIELQANSIEQQNQALEVQSKALEAQIEELKASREESKKQTEEFFIQNMNVKLDRYYGLLTKLINNCDEDIATNYINTEKAIIERQNNPLDRMFGDNETHLNAFKQKKDNYKYKILSILNILKLIHKEIKNIKNSTYYIQFLDELILRMQSEKVLHNIYETDLSSIELSDSHIRILKLLDTQSNYL